VPFPEWAINPLPKQHRLRGDSHGSIPKPGHEWRLVDHSDSTMWWQQAAASGSLGTSYMRDNVRALHMRDSTFLAHSTRRSRQTQIEGLRHGGWGGGRRSRTDFGSGWRGLVKVPQNALPREPGFAWVAPDFAKQQNELSFYLDRAEERGIKPEAAAKLRRDLQGAEAYRNKTGFEPVFVSESAAKESPTELRSVLRHERIHSLHSASKDSPVIQEAIASGPDLEGALRSHYTHLGVDPARVSIKAKATRMIYQSSYRGAPNEEFALSSERLAFGNMHDKTFFRRMRSAGLPDPRVVMKSGASRETVTMANKSLKAARGARRMSRAL
jgi:hypothetical protein